MSRLDNEIHALKVRLATLEIKKQEEEHAKMSSNNFNTLGQFIDETKDRIQRNRYSKSVPLARFYDEQKVTYLEAIFNILNDIDSRLRKLE